MTDTERSTHLSRNRSAAGVRHSTALRAGVLMSTIKVQVPRPVCVVVPPTTLELREKQRQHSIGLNLDSWSCSNLYPASLGFSRGETQASKVSADGGGISQEEPRRAQELYVTCSLSCGNPSTKAKRMQLCGVFLWFTGLQINLKMCVMWIAKDTSKDTPAERHWPEYLFLDVIHQILQIQVIPVVHDGFLHKLSQSTPGLREVRERENCSVHFHMY